MVLLAAQGRGGQQQPGGLEMMIVILAIGAALIGTMLRAAGEAGMW